MQAQGGVYLRLFARSLRNKPLQARVGPRSGHVLEWQVSIMLLLAAVSASIVPLPVHAQGIELKLPAITQHFRGTGERWVVVRDPRAT